MFLFTETCWPNTKNLHAEVGVSDPAAEPVTTDYCTTVLGLLSKKDGACGKGTGL